MQGKTQQTKGSDTKTHKKFGLHNGSLNQSMRHSENTKIKLITMI